MRGYEFRRRIFAFDTTNLLLGGFLRLSGRLDFAGQGDETPSLVYPRLIYRHARQSRTARTAWRWSSGIPIPVTAGHIRCSRREGVGPWVAALGSGGKSRQVMHPPDLVNDSTLRGQYAVGQADERAVTIGR